jgi:HEPN domain-containing protein
MRPDPNTPEAWLDSATSDMKLARAGFVPDVHLEHLCFHAQQAAEKSLKAVLVASGVDFPKTHSLEFLVGLLPTGIARSPLLVDAARLTEYATAARYPGEEEPVTEDEYQELMSLAARVLAWAREQLARHPNA